MATKELPSVLFAGVQINGDKVDPTTANKLVDRELFLNTSNYYLWTKSATSDIPVKINSGTSDKTLSFTNNPTNTILNSAAPVQYIGNFTVHGSDPCIWQAQYSGNTFDKYNTFRNINIEQVNRIVLQRNNGVSFGTTFPTTNLVDGQIFFKLAE